ncbi:hypothetical protein BKP37_16145 [Anaerobacillus alkalilacustris]|uniref:Uncharacterized protein n=1 Tax=Anaerobacillus alkalilacustris TaxID=393763 RepID=A0A1S2LFP2_9BACI|nr:GerAB/ArcD/ProY family transporter [Anaerobacillus alkalilacustris]OIJ11186.1 hypothetical protein BKP37_16145 [Anaerobacillus alkalilacustris]
MHEKIHYSQLAIMVYMVQSGIIIFALPRIVAEAFGMNGWLGIMGLSVLVNLYFIILVYKKGEGRSVFTIVEASLPKFLYYPLYIFMITTFGLLAVLVAKNYVMRIQLTMFPDVKPNYFLVYFLLLILFFLSKGIYNMSKITVVFFFSTVWLIFLLFILIPEFSFTRLTTFFFQGATDPIGKGIEAYTSFLGYELTLFLIPYVQKDGNFGKAIVFGHLFTTFIYTVICFMTMGFFSFNQLKNILYPTHTILKFMQTPLIERIENFVFAFFLLKVIVTVAFYYWAALEVSQSMLKSVNKKWLIALIFLGSFLVGAVLDVQREINELFTIITIPQIIFAFSFPLLLLCLLWLNKRKERMNTEIA